MDIKYRTEQVFEGAKAQDFSQFSPVYEYDPVLCRPVKVGEKDDQEYIQSFECMALDKILEKFTFDSALPSIEFTDDVVDGTEALDDLADLADVLDTVQAFREKYSLSENMPTVDVLRFVQKKAQEEIEKSGDVGKNSSVVAGQPADGSVVPGSDSDVVENDKEEII